jgi:aspartate racemase
MKVIGLLGGMSWESTDYYYQQLNRGVRDRLGKLHSALCVVYSVDFATVEAMQAEGAWDEAGDYLGSCAKSLEAAGADIIILCTNTMHRVYQSLQDAVAKPVVHIADGTADALVDAGIKKVALLGTRYTMEQPFYRERLEQRGLEVVVPEPEDRALVHKIIYSELCVGHVLQSSRDTYLSIIDSLASRGAEAVILGCTEIGLLIDQANCPLPVFDTTLLHVKSALDLALEK